MRPANLPNRFIESGINIATQSPDRTRYRSRAPALIVIHNVAQEPLCRGDSGLAGVGRAVRAFITRMKPVERLETPALWAPSCSTAIGLKLNPAWPLAPKARTARPTAVQF